MAQYVPSSANIRRYGEIVRKKSTLRKLAAAGELISQSAFETRGAPIEHVLDEAETTILSIGGNGLTRKSEIKNIDFQKARFLEQLQLRADNPGQISGVRSGYVALDDCLNGFQDGDLIVLAGRPSMGKTALAINIAECCAFEQQKATLVISIEMTADQLTTRVAGSIGRVDQTNLSRGVLNDGEWARVFDAMEAMTGMFEIEDVGVETVAGIRAVARRFVKRNGKPGLIVVDHLQMMHSDKGENRNAEISQISNGLKLLAKELCCPVLVLSQLNRQVEQRPNKRPVRSDLRESGAIEQDADVILFIYRDEYYYKEASQDPGVAEIIIAKQRNGPTGTVRLGWEPSYTRFSNL